MYKAMFFCLQAAVNYILGVEQTRTGEENAVKPSLSVRRRFSFMAKLLIQTIRTAAKLFADVQTNQPEGTIQSLLKSLADWCPRGELQT